MTRQAAFPSDGTSASVSKEQPRKQTHCTLNPWTSLAILKSDCSCLFISLTSTPSLSNLSSAQVESTKIHLTVTVKRLSNRKK